MEVLPQYSEYCGREKCFSISILHNWESWVFIQCFPYPPWDRSPQATSALYCATLVEEQCWQSSSYPLQHNQTLISVVTVVQLSAGISPQETWTSKRLSHLCVSAQISSLQVYLNCSQEGLGLVHRLLLVQQPIPRTVPYYLIHKWLRLLPGPLVYSVGSHNAHRGKLWMYAKF